MGPIHSFDDLIDLLRRRIWLIGIVTIIGTILSLGFAASQKHLYMSQEVLQVQAPRVAGDLAPTVVSGSSARRLQLIEQQLMSRASLLDVIDKLGLFTDLPGASPSEKAQLLRHSVTIAGVAAVREGYSDDGTVALLRISATMPDPFLAQQVAHEMSVRTVALSQSTRLTNARETRAFFADQAAAVLRRQATLEAEIERYRQRNDVSRLETAESHRREIETLTQDILTIDRQLLTLNQQVAAIDAVAAPSRLEIRQKTESQKQIDALNGQRSLLQRRVNALARSVEGSAGIQRQLDAYDRQLAAVRAEYASVEEKLGEAEIALRLEEEAQAERLTVLEAATVPDYPFTPSRKKLVLMGALASIVAGFIIAFLVDLTRPVLRTAAQMKSATGISPIVSIPTIKPDRKRKT